MITDKIFQRRTFENRENVRSGIAKMLVIDVYQVLVYMYRRERAICLFLPALFVGDP